jgi:FK506-binding protein 1
MGVTKEILREGDGTTFPKKGESLTMHYKGTLASDGSQFDSSYDKGRPFQFKIGRGEVIQGWDEGGTYHIPGSLGVRNRCYLKNL